MEYLELAEGLKPVIKDTIEKLINFGPELMAVFSSLVSGTVDLRIQAVSQFEAAGFTREEAIYMTMDEWWGLKNLSSKKKRKND